MQINETVSRWPETVIKCSTEARSKYRSGILFPEWFRTHGTKWPFEDQLFSSDQIPHSGPTKKDAFFFNEFLVAVEFLKLGYESLLFYQPGEYSGLSYAKAKEILGNVADDIIYKREKGGRPPDLLVFDPSRLAFRFVECKRIGERFTAKQPERFKQIETCLREKVDLSRKLAGDLSRPELFPELQSGQWIQIARVA